MTFDPTTFRLNSPLGKRILAVARDGDYAHPGEEEAIRRTLGSLAGNGKQRWLDAGCGRGGTAAFVARMGWAGVTAFDVDAVSVREARQSFPEVSFYECGVMEAPEVIPGKFDLVYAFNAFYAFPDQAGALRALRSLAAESGRLVLFDYMDRGGFFDSPLSRLPEAAHWRPIEGKALGEWLAAAGWELEEVENLDADYERWYVWLVSRFDARCEALAAFAPTEAIDYARNFFSAVLDAIRKRALGGGIIRARAMA